MGNEAYEAGYRAGHLQGWLDAMARIQGPTTAGGSAPRLAASVPPSEVPISMAPASPFAAVSPLPPVTAPAPPALVAVSAPPVPQAAPALRAPSHAEASHAQTLRAEGPVRPAPETPAERQARREKRDRQNINITLYVASLMLVAAAALFIGTSLPPVLRFAGVCVVTALFYGSGFALLARVPRLKPAAVAFTGTGLAMVPVTGLALYNFALHDGPAAWLITSLIGTAGYIAAAVRLESRVLVYLSLTFVASTAFSGVSILGGALVWYFAVLIGVATLLTALAMVRPGWLPPVYIRPLTVLHPMVVPAVAAAATVVPLLLDKAEYALVMGMCGLYFALMAAVPLSSAMSGRQRLLNFYGARAALTVAAAVALWNLTGRGSDALLAAAALFAVQAVAVALMFGRLALWFAQPKGTSSTDVRGAPGDGDGRWRVDASLTFGLQLVATAVFGLQELAIGLFRGTAFASEYAGMVPLWVPVGLSLATGMVLAIRWAGRTEWAPVAALALAVIASPSMGAWPLAVMLVLSAGYWAARAVYSAGDFRGRLVLGARVALTFAVPVTVAALMDNDLRRVEASVFALLVALVCQQVLTAILERAGLRAISPQATLGVFGAGGALVLIGLPVFETSLDHALTAAGLFLQLVAALVIGAMMVPRPAAEKDWSASVGEALPLGISVVTAAVAFQAVSQRAGNMALLLVVAYLMATALRLQFRQHRWTYWWLGRAAATVLVLTAFHQLRAESGPLVLAGQVLQPATVLVIVLALQLSFPLIAAARRRAPRYVVADAVAVLLVQLACSATLARGDSPDWQGTWAIGLVALCAAAAGYFLRSESGAVWLAPASLVLLLALSGGDLLQVELVIGVYAVYSTLMVVAEPQRVRKGWYFVAARVLTAALALVLSYDLTASPTVVSLTFAAVLAAQHAVRWLMRSRLTEVPFQQAAVWITLAGQAVLPLAYIVGPGITTAAGRDHDGGRWVVLLELLMLLASAVVARRLFIARGALYFAVYALLFGVLALGPLVTFGGTFLIQPVLSHTGAAVVLLLLAVLATVAGAIRRQRNVAVGGVEHWLWLVTACLSGVLAVLISPLAGNWVTGAAVLVLSAVGFTASHVEELPQFYPPAALAALGGGVILAADAYAEMPGVWGGFLPWLIGAGAASAILYAARLHQSDRLQGDPVRRWSLAGAAFLGLILVALAGVRHDATSWAAAAVVAAAVGVAHQEAPLRVRRLVLEVGALLLTATVQRAALFEFDGSGGRLWAGLPDPFWVIQWYVVLAAALGFLRYLSGSPSAGRFLTGAAAGLLSMSGLGILFGGGGGQQLWVLVLLALLLVAGLGLGERLFVWWGAAGVAACILWAMRNYTFLLLAVIAAGLIAFAVWRLNRGAVSGPAADGTGPESDGPGSEGPVPAGREPVGHEPVGHGTAGPRDPYSGP
ncbi:hypothetical protein [Pseudarthrobacter sp. DSP2-3-2b1]|uniref:hypothetical protein n=1 Tax=Pseudarthrobacter sp. DSP2-3-2b1 TaxID=2804661 RepID=UPI003CE6CC5D